MKAPRHGCLSWCDPLSRVNGGSGSIYLLRQTLARDPSLVRGAGLAGKGTFHRPLITSPRPPGARAEGTRDAPQIFIKSMTCGLRRPSPTRDRGARAPSPRSVGTRSPPLRRPDRPEEPIDLAAHVVRL